MNDLNRRGSGAGSMEASRGLGTAGTQTLTSDATTETPVPAGHQPQPGLSSQTWDKATAGSGVGLAAIGGRFIG